MPLKCLLSTTLVLFKYHIIATSAPFQYHFSATYVPLSADEQLACIFDHSKIYNKILEKQLFLCKQKV